MDNNIISNIDDAIITQLGLEVAKEHVNADIAPNARVFKYPFIENVFIMESDLYGNVMPKDSLFLAFYGRNGLVGKHVTIEELKRYNQKDIENIVKSNFEG